MGEKDSAATMVNPFVLIPSTDKAVLRPFLASAAGASLKRQLTAPERLLGAAGDGNPLRGVSAVLLAQAVLDDVPAAAALRQDDPELFAAAEVLAGTRAEVGPRQPRPGPRPKFGAERVAALATLATGAIHAAAAVPAPFLAAEIEDAEDLIDAVKDIGGAVKGGADLIKELRKLIREWQRRNRGDPGSATGPGGEESAAPPEAEVPFIVPDEFAQLYGETLPGEMVHSVWLDQVGAFEVDGAGADNVFWVAQAFVHMKDPLNVVASANLSHEYDLDEFEEARFSPLADVPPGRGAMVQSTDWKVKHAIRDRDAILAIRRGNDTHWFPLSKLRHVELFVDLYDSDDAPLAEAAIAAIITAVVAALAFFKGKITPSIGSTAELTRANQDALDKLFELINGNDLLVEGVFNFVPADFEDAFAQGVRFDVLNHRSQAAAGRPFQRRVQARGEDGKVYDTGTADAFNATNPGVSTSRAYWEDEFDSYYEIRLRFERRSPT